MEAAPSDDHGAALRAVLLPAAMPLSMAGVFPVLRRRFGPERGLQAGFAVYWAACWAGALLDRRVVFAAWGRPRRPHHPLLLTAGLAVAPVGAVLTQLLPNLPGVRLRTIVTAVGVGATNALAEEAFWRGRLTRARLDRAAVWSIAAFTAWHLVPLAGRSRRGDPWPLLGGAALLGTVGAWSAAATGSLVPAALAHAITDACGLHAAETIWGTRGDG